MPRNAEVIRQWTILRELESSRRLTIDEMAEKTGVTTRTIRRDLEALQFVGFPIYDEVYDGKKYLAARAAGVQTARRHRLHVRGAERPLLQPHARRVPVGHAVSDRRAERVRQAGGGADAGDAAVPRSPAARHPGQGGTRGHRPAASRTKEIGQLLDATLQHRRAIMRYHSFSSEREKEYTIEPSRVVFAQGALYLVAYVPEYPALRTFAVDRIKSLSLTEERFEPAADDEEAFAHPLGVHQGVPERIEIAFEPRIAPYVRERLWHSSQEIATRATDGSSSR